MNVWKDATVVRQQGRQSTYWVLILQTLFISFPQHTMAPSLPADPKVSLSASRSAIMAECSFNTCFSLTVVSLMDKQWMSPAWLPKTVFRHLSDRFRRKPSWLTNKNCIALICYAFHVAPVFWNEKGCWYAVCEVACRAWYLARLWRMVQNVIVTFHSIRKSETVVF